MSSSFKTFGITIIILLSGAICCAQQPEQVQPTYVPEIIIRTADRIELEASQSILMPIKIENVGDSRLENILVDISPSEEGQTNVVQGQVDDSPETPANPLVILGSTQRSIDSLDTGESMDISYRVAALPDTVEGYYYLNFNVSYIRRNRPYNYTTYVGINVYTKISPINIEVLDVEFEKGKTSDLRLDVRNIGDELVEDISLKLLPEEQMENESATTSTIVPTQSVETGELGILVAGSNTRYIGNMHAGESRNVNFKVVSDSDVESNIYSLNLQIEYKARGITRVDNVSIGLRIMGRPEISLSDLKINPVGMKQNSTIYEISGDAAGIGTGDAKYVIIEATESETIHPASESSTYFIGTLHPDDFVSFNIKVEAEPNHELTYKLKVKYLDESNDERVEYIEIPFKGPGESDIESNGHNYWIFPIIATVIVIGIFIWKRRKRKQ